MTDPAQHVQLLEASRMQSVNGLAAAIISASGRPWSIQEAMDLRLDVYFAMYPDAGSGRYKEWAKTKDDRLKKVHGPN